MKLKNILLLTILTWGNSLKMASTAVTGDKIFKDIIQKTSNAFSFVQNAGIITFLNEIVWATPCALNDTIDITQNGNIFARSAKTGEKDKLLSVPFAECLFTRDGVGSTADKKLATFLPKIEAILKIQLVKECLNDILNMDLSSSITDTATVKNLTALTAMQTGYKTANITLFLKGLKDLTFFKDDSGMKFVKTDGTLIEEPKTDPDKSLLAKLFGTKTIFGVPTLTPAIFLQVIKLTAADVGTSGNVEEIQALGEIVHGSPTKDVPTVATAILAKAQAYITKCNIIHFNGTGYGTDSNCEETKFDQTAYDKAIKEQYYTKQDYDTDIKNAQGGKPVNITVQDIIGALKTDAVTKDVIKEATAALDLLKKKTNQTADETNQIKALEELLSNSQQGGNQSGSNVDQDKVLKFISDKDQAEGLKRAMEAKITTLEAKTDKTADETNELEGYKVFKVSTQTTSVQNLTYWGVLKEGSNGQKAWFILLPLGTGILGAGTVYLMKNNNSENPEIRMDNEESQSGQLVA